MKATSYFGIFFCITAFPSFERVQQVSHEELAYRYAPVHFQDTDNTHAAADYITKADFDGNWRGTDNWDHLRTGNLAAHVYYSVVETDTHWFIVYAFFHPRDWSDSGEEVHENDLEGVLTIVGKSGGAMGNLQGMITVFHNDFYSYTPRGSPLRAGSETIDGDISFQRWDNADHPRTAQESKGHGIKAWPHIEDFTGSLSQDGIIYYPSRTRAEIPSNGNDRNVRYQLVNVHAGMWFMQMFEATRSYDQSTAFAKWGTFKGDNSGGCGGAFPFRCPRDKANAPWGWDDEDDGENYSGELALDPAAVADDYFNGVTFDKTYKRNRYLENLKAAGYTRNFLPRGWPSQLPIEDLYRKLKQQ